MPSPAECHPGCMPSSSPSRRHWCLRSPVGSIAVYGSQRLITMVSLKKGRLRFSKRVLYSIQVSVDRSSNERVWILTRQDLEEKLLAHIRKLKLRWTYNEVSDTRRRSRLQSRVGPRWRWRNDFSEWTGLWINDTAARSAENRELTREECHTCR